MSQASRRHTRFLVSAYLLLQVGVPAVQLAAPDPARYGWQMFDAVADADFVLIDDIGPSTIDPGDFVVASRGDVDAAAYLPAHLCAVVPETREVRVLRSADTIPGVFPCGAP